MAGLDGFLGRSDDVDGDAVSVEIDLTIGGLNGRPKITDFLPVLLARPDALGGSGSGIKVVKGPDDRAAVVSARGVTRDELSGALQRLNFQIAD